MSLSKSIEDYLEALYILETRHEETKAVSIARMLNVSKPAVTKAMNELLIKGFITKELYKEISLTSEGREIAKDVFHRHLVIHEFLEKTLGLSHEIAEKDCCLIEHVISKETLNAMEKMNKK